MIRTTDGRTQASSRLPLYHKHPVGQHARELVVLAHGTLVPIVPRPAVMGTEQRCRDWLKESWNLESNELGMDTRGGFFFFFLFFGLEGSGRQVDCWFLLHSSST